MTRGRRPQPTAMKLLSGRSPGTDSGDRVVPDEPFDNGTEMTAPDWLSEEARAEWDRVAPTLTRLKLTKAEDAAVFAAYCETWSTYKRATIKLAKRPLTIKNVVQTDDGPVEKEAINPLWRVVKESGGELLKFAREFGLTPVGGAQLAGALHKAKPEGDGDNPYAGTKAS